LKRSIYQLRFLCALLFRFLVVLPRFSREVEAPPETRSAGFGRNENMEQEVTESTEKEIDSIEDSKPKYASQRDLTRSV